MEMLKQGSLTTSGRVSIDENETQMAYADDVTLTSTKKEVLKCKNAIVSTLNVWMCTDSHTTWKLPLLYVLKAQVHSSMFRREKYIEFFFARDPSQALLRLTFSGSEIHEFFSGLQISLERQGWKEKKKIVARDDNFSTTFAGVGGLMKRREQEREQTNSLASEAFIDLSALLDSASEIVGLAERFSRAMRKESSSKADEDDFFGILNDMGIANPATKKACGSRYHEELARELADFLHQHLGKHARSGVIALTDLYCLVNRARGTQLVSPNDLYQACTLMEVLGLHYKLKRFSSGVCVLQDAKNDDKHIANRLLALLENCDCLTAVNVAHSEKQSLQVAQEQLLQTENLGMLCRDETPQGICFYANRFAIA